MKTYKFLFKIKCLYNLGIQIHSSPVRLKFGAIVLSARVNQIRPRLMHTAADTSARLYRFPMWDKGKLASLCKHLSSLLSDHGASPSRTGMCCSCSMLKSWRTLRSRHTAIPGGLRLKQAPHDHVRQKWDLILSIITKKQNQAKHKTTHMHSLMVRICPENVPEGDLVVWHHQDTYTDWDGYDVTG